MLDLPQVGLVLESGKPHFSLRSDNEWGTIFPKGNGFINIETSDTHNRTFAISMIHQLHCLDVIRVGFVVNRTGSAAHIQHCLRLLRQIVLCNADATLEVASPGVIEGGHIVDEGVGVGAVHRCKDWTALRDYMDEHAAGPISP